MWSKYAASSVTDRSSERERTAAPSLRARLAGASTEKQAMRSGDVMRYGHPAGVGGFEHRPHAVPETVM